MYRNMVNDLAAWQESGAEKLLLLKGARGVGKTWCVRDFAEAFYAKTIHIEFEKDTILRELFMVPNRPEFIDEQLKVLTDIDMATVNPKEVLIIFDDVQVEEDLFAGVLQYARQRQQFPIVMIASWVGSLPAENLVEEEILIKTMYPMTFEEFLIANKAQELCRIIEQEKVSGIADDLRPMLMDYLRYFYITGGMPEVVLDFIKHRDMGKIDIIQHRILQELRDDILRYAPKLLVKKILQVWDSIPEQLTKDNKKFMYGVIDVKARAREYEGAVQWLVDAGYVRKIHKVSKGIAPIEEYIERKSFELYHLDHGLLRNVAGIVAKDAALNNDIFDAMNGILSEQLVLAELTLNANVKELFFWTSDATARIDFIFEDDGEVIPVDVQTTIRTKAQNLKVFHQKYGNRMAIRISLESLSFHKGRLNVPIYGLWNF
ncbi:MAG: ATP-binding protein [Lachnospiraceae bacterium]|nr:ATP-binding protein [Lachnospiraceae bacterium]